MAKIDNERVYIDEPTITFGDRQKYILIHEGIIMGIVNVSESNLADGARIAKQMRDIGFEFKLFVSPCLYKTCKTTKNLAKYVQEKLLS